MKTREKSDKSIFNSIFISYCIACIIILGITGLGYANYYRLFKENTVAFARQQADMVTTQVERGFIKIQQALGTLSQNSTGQKFSKQTDAQMVPLLTEIGGFQKEMSSTLPNDECSDIYAYFYNSNSVIGARSRRFNSEMLPLFFSSHGVTEDEFMEIINYKGSYGSFVFDDGRVWMMKAMYDREFQRTGVMIVEARLEKFINLLDEAYRDNYLLLAAKDTLLYNYGSMDTEAFAALVNSSEENVDLKIDGKPYYFVSAEISAMGWRCFVGIPEEKLYKELRIFWVLLVCEFAGAIVLMLFISWKFAKKTYQPVEQLVEILNNGTDNRFKETYQSLSEKLKYMAEENRRMEKREKKSRQYLIRQKASRIIRGEINDEVLVGETMAAFAGIEKDGLWIMALIRIPEDPAGLFRYDQYHMVNSEGIELEYFVLSNVLNELIFCDFPGNLVLEEDNYVLCMQLEDEGSRDTLAEKLQYLMDFYKNAFDLEIYTVLGRCVRHFTNVADIYTELKDEMRYNYFWMDDDSRGKVWELVTLTGEETSVAFNEYLDSSRRLVNSLEASDYSEAYKVMEYIYHHTFPKNKRYLKYNVYRMYGLISTVTMSLNMRANPEDREFLEQLHYEERMFRAKTVRQLMEESKKLFTALIEYNAENKKNGMPGWMPAVLEYIQDNLTDMNISVADIADKFQLSVPHLSRTFKTWMGSGMLEYIHKLRVEAAKKYLAGGDTINDAAQKVGYLDAKALTRAFKRYEGITPGQFKESRGQRG